MSSTTDLLVIGAGFAGLTAAALAARRGMSTVVVEAHETFGGCAGFFRVGRRTFDVGATTLSAVQSHQPFGRVIEELGLSVDLVRQDVGVSIRMDGATIHRYADIDRWIDECEQHFEGGKGAHRRFWTRVHDVEREIWELLASTPLSPLTSIRSAAALLHPSVLKHVGKATGLVRPVQSMLRRYGLDAGERFRRFLDEQLLISTQNTTYRTPWLTGVMGLAYPADTWYPHGGMMRPALELYRSAQRDGADVLFRRRVTALRRDGMLWHVDMVNTVGENQHHETIVARNVVSTIPIWNLEGIVHDGVRRWLSTYTQRFSTSWAAITAYLETDTVIQLPSQYLQIHLNSDLPFVASKSIFVTISQDTDVQRTSSGTVMTVSAHVHAKDWEHLSEDEYNRRRVVVEEGILRAVREALPELQHSLRIAGFGSPATWQKYTGRHRGYVGGLPHDIRRPLLMFPPNVTPFSGLYLAGDTVFPGQGTPAVMHGAHTVIRHIAAQ